MKTLSLCLLASILAVVVCAKVSFAAEIPSQAFSINNATVGVATLDEIQKTYGIAKISRVSRDDEADVTMCYAHSSPKGRSFLVFESGAMGSFKHITGFRLSTLRRNGNCVSTKIDVGTLTTGNGVRLGQGRVDFEKAFPIDFRRHGSELIYEAVSERAAAYEAVSERGATYEAVSERGATAEELKRLRTQWPNEKQDYFDVSITIKAKFKSNRLIDLYVHKIESN